MRIYEVGRHEGLPYFSLEYIDGASLADRLQSGPLTLIEAARITERIARALDYAHQQGVIHRDLKPGNVLMTSDGVPKVADFGLAKTLEGAEEFSQSGSIVGTPGYMAPEQARGDQDVGPAADIYGLGAVLYCMLTVRPPFQGATASETLMQLLQREPVQPSQLRPDVPADLETICIKCLQKSPEARYATAGELAEDLARFARGEPILARPIPRVERVWRWCRRNPTIAVPSVIAAMLALALMVGGPLAAGIIYQQKQTVLAANEVAERNEQAAREAEKIAETNAAEAQAAQEVAQAKAEEARLAQAAADANAQKAQEQQKVAVDALKSMTFQVQREMDGRRDLQPLRRQLISVVQDGLQRMEETGGPSGEANIITAGTQRRLGDLAAEINALSLAWKHYRQCLELLEQLEANGSLPSPHHNLSTVHHLLADTASRMHRYDLAKEHAMQALAIRREWLDAADSAKRDFVQENIAATLGLLASLNLSQGHLDAAEPLFVEAATLRQNVLEKTPDDHDRRREWLGSQWGLARLAMQQGRLGHALSEFERLIDYIDSNLAGSGDWSSMELNRVLLQLDRGKTLLYLDRIGEAEQVFEQAAATADGIAETSPAAARAQPILSNALYGLSVCQQVRGATDAAAESIERCSKIRGEQLAADPDVLSHQIALLYAKARQGQISSQAELLRSVEEADFNDTYVHYQLAAIYALAADSAMHEQASERRAKALAHLSHAVEGGYRRLADLQHDPDLAAVRNEPGFPKLDSLVTASE